MIDTARTNTGAKPPAPKGSARPPGAGVLLARAVRLRCPNCGRGRPFLSWFRMREACSECGLRMQRNEESDYWVGGWLINFIIAELIVSAAMALLVWSLWPDVPWTAILWITAAAAVTGPLLTWPVSRTLWLGIDLAFRPPENEDFVDDPRHRAN
jgi:uncharacterized protein (DUF983 family)